MNRLILLLLVMACGTACSAKYNVPAWQEKTAVPREEAGWDRFDRDAARVDELRTSGHLSEARTLALSLAAENPDHQAALWRAARAESDAVFLFHDHEREQRALAALSSLEYSRRATSGDGPPAEALAELAWSLGTTTHLQPMFARSGHARETLAAIDAALAADAANHTAHATGALLNFRLSTLPWIAKVMARSAPPSSLEQALAEIDAALSVHPSLQYQLIKAKILSAMDRRDDALASLSAALAKPDRLPRDFEARIEAAGWLKANSPADDD